MPDDKNITQLAEVAKITSCFQSSLRKESERGSAIICATLMEESLYRLIKAKLVPSPEKNDELLNEPYSPLGNFSAKIDFAYRIGLIDLNQFAHSSEEINFESAVVKDRIRELFRLNCGLLNILGNAAKRIPQIDKILPKDLDSEQGMDFIVKSVGWREVYEMLGSILAAAIQFKCNQIEHMKPLIISD